MSNAKGERLAAAAEELLKAALIQSENNVIQVATDSLQELKGIKGTVDSKTNSVIESINALKQQCNANHTVVHTALITSMNGLKATIEAQFAAQTQMMEAQNRISICQWAIPYVERKMAERLKVEGSFTYYAKTARAGFGERQESIDLVKSVLFFFLRKQGHFIDDKSTDQGMSEAGKKEFREKFAAQLEGLTGMTHHIGMSDGKYAIWYSKP
jgi:hypothetical protein